MTNEKEIENIIAQNSGFADSSIEKLAKAIQQHIEKKVQEAREDVLKEQQGFMAKLKGDEDELS